MMIIIIIIKNKPNYSAPGLDAINAFWWKKLTVTHQHLADICNKFIDGTMEIPEQLCEGRAVLIYIHVPSSQFLYIYIDIYKGYIKEIQLIPKL